MDWSRVTQMGLDAHRKFSNLTGRDGDGRIVCRRPLDHRDRRILRTNPALRALGSHSCVALSSRKTKRE